MTRGSLTLSLLNVFKPPLQGPLYRESLPPLQGFYIKGLVTPANIVYFRFKTTSLAPPGDAGVRRVCGRKLAWATRDVVQRLISRI